MYLSQFLFFSSLGKSFAFVEFSTHAAAKAVVEASVRRGVVLQGRTISIGEREREGRERERDRGEGER
jgi:RNA recognition motif-containing protein